LGTVEIVNNSFDATTSLNMDGDSVEASVSARFNGDRISGSLKLQNAPELPFTGSKD